MSVALRPTVHSLPEAVESVSCTKAADLVSMRVARGSASLLSSHGRGLWPRDVSDLHLEKAVAPHSSTLAWKIPWTGEPGGLQS